MWQRVVFVHELLCAAWQHCYRVVHSWEYEDDIMFWYSCSTSCFVCVKLDENHWKKRRRYETNKDLPKSWCSFVWLQIQSVRQAVRDQNLSDSEILAVLQCCDYSIEQTVTALQKGLLALYCCTWMLNTAIATSCANYCFHWSILFLSNRCCSFRCTWVIWWCCKDFWDACCWHVTHLFIGTCGPCGIVGRWLQWSVSMYLCPVLAGLPHSHTELLCHRTIYLLVLYEVLQPFLAPSTYL